MQDRLSITSTHERESNRPTMIGLLEETRQRASETLPELGQTIRRLVNRAYPLSPTKVKETLAKDYFLDALQDSEMRIKIKQSRPQNLNQAICLAVELEAFYKAEKRQDFRECRLRKQGGNGNGQYRNHENGSARPVHSRTRRQRRKQIKLNVQNNSTKEAGAYTDVAIGNIKARFLVDTGATVTLISNKLFNSLRKEEMPNINQVVQTIMSANGTELNVAGKGRDKRRQNIIDIHKDKNIRIELQKLLRNCNGNLSQEQKRGVENLLNESKDLFAASDRDLGRTNLVRYTITAENNAPVKQPPRRTPIHMREEVDMHINDMLERGVIEPADGPWSSGIVVVKKKDGTTRFCVDYRKVNILTNK
ncbi:unnamed protein product [Mytilus edulis]|uniref:Peptidase A2 domain-containing protein n=1 Tax=Mytilus edulis TaxID=6550 RepID=A0A8S3R9Z4_MYTED|nr:unnamed protein product [Mytilus edulis]